MRYRRRTMTERATQDQQAGIIAQQRQTISELETPVIQGWDGVLAIPIVGSLDPARTREMNERLLQRYGDTGSESVLRGTAGGAPVDTAAARRRAEAVH